MNGVHDMGGMQDFGPVVPEIDEPPFHYAWERRVFGLTIAMGATGAWNLDQSRFARLALVTATFTACLLLVGTYVRASGSQLVFTDWPLMDGRLVPTLGGAATAMFLHRVLAGASLLLILWLAIRARTLPRRSRDLTALSTLALVLLLALGVLATTGVAVWKAAHSDDARRVDHADLIIVLGAAQYGGTPSPVFEARLQHAQLLFDNGFGDRVLVVGGGQPGDATTEGDAGRTWLISQGLPESDVFSSPEGGTTYESLKAAARWMRDRSLDTAFLVSDPWHNLRIRRMASDLGIHGFVSAAFHSAASSQWRRFDGYSRETFAYLYYRILGR